MKDLLIIAGVGFAMYAFLNSRKDSMLVSQNSINYAWPHSNSNPYMDLSEYSGMPFTGINFTK